MPPPPPHDKARSDNNCPRKPRLLFDYVDLVKARPSLQTLVPIKRTKTSRTVLESWEAVSPSRSNLHSLQSGSQPVISSAPMRRRHPQQSVQPSIHKPLPSLPPSSPLVSSPRESNLAELLKDDEDTEETDPFGFFAAEKKLKLQRPCFTSANPYPEMPRRKEYCYSGEEVFSGNAFATQVSEGIEQHKTHTIPVTQRKHRFAAPVSPSTSSVLTDGSNNPSSPCLQVIRRRSIVRSGIPGKRMGREVDAGKDNHNVLKEDSKPTTIELEALLPKRSKKHPQNQGGVIARKTRKTSKSRNTRHEAKASSVQTPLSHLTDEDKEKFKRDREERVAYYKRLDSYHVAKENVWMV